MGEAGAEARHTGLGLSGESPALKQAASMLHPISPKELDPKEFDPEEFEEI